MKGTLWNVLKPVKNCGGFSLSPHREFDIGDTLICLGTYPYGTWEADMHVLIDCYGHRQGVPLELAIKRGLIEEIK